MFSAWLFFIVSSPRLLATLIWLGPEGNRKRHHDRITEKVRNKRLIKFPGTNDRSETDIYILINCPLGNEENSLEDFRRPRDRHNVKSSRSQLDIVTTITNS